jgi:hypothetical protein
VSPTRKARLKRHYFKLRPFKRHSLVLMVAGVVYVVNGLSYMLTTPTPARLEALTVSLKWFPLDVWGGVWVAVGLLAVISSRWPPVFESWGYMVLTGLAAGWSATYLMGIVFYHTHMTNLSGVLTWGLLAFLWWAVSGLLNPDKEAVQTHGTGGDS